MAEAHSTAMRLDQELRRELAAGERILWQERPAAKRLLPAFGVWLFAIPWTAFSLGWTGVALAAYLSAFGTEHVQAMRWGWIMPLFGTPFIAVGLWMLNQPVRILRDARYTVHALTTERLMTLTSRKVREVKSVALDRLGPVTRKERADGWGSLSVETGSHIDGEGDRITDRFSIDGVPNVARLEQLIQENRKRRDQSSM